MQESSMSMVHYEDIIILRVWHVRSGASTSVHPYAQPRMDLYKTKGITGNWISNLMIRVPFSHMHCDWT